MLVAKPSMLRILALSLVLTTSLSVASFGQSAADATLLDLNQQIVRAKLSRLGGRSLMVVGILPSILGFGNLLYSIFAPQRAGPWWVTLSMAPLGAATVVGGRRIVARSNESLEQLTARRGDMIRLAPTMTPPPSSQPERELVIFDCDLFIAMELAKGNRVGVLILQPEVILSAQCAEFLDVEDWRREMRRRTETNRMSLLVGLHDDDENFAVVDRSVVGEILEEIEFQMTGLTVSEDALRLGRLHSATLLQIIHQEYRCHSEAEGATDYIEYRLVDIETGRVVAIDTEEYHYEWDYETDASRLMWHKVNYRETEVVGGKVYYKQ